MKKLLISLVILIILTGLGIGGYFILKKSPQSTPATETETSSTTETSVTKPDPETDNFTYTLPEEASPIRLSLPAEIEEIFYSEKTGVAGFGLHAGGHPEGLDHVWIKIKQGTIVKSWADGTVTDVRLSGMVEEGEYHVTVDYGQNLIGIHMEIEESLVKKGDTVKRGQAIGHGMNYSSTTSAEFGLADMGRTDGVKYGGSGVYVSPYDYLKDSDKNELIKAYKKYIKSYSEERSNVSLYKPYQPYLTNNIFLHEENKNKLTGAWYCLSSNWSPDPPVDVLTFIEAKNPYYTGNVVLSDEDQGGGMQLEWVLGGTFKVNYKKGQIKITNYNNDIYFGIFEIDESKERARLKIEYQKNSYPTKFSSKANTYIERGDTSRRDDAVKLGVLDSL